MKQSDISHLIWVTNRLVAVYGENENVDFVLKMREIINSEASQQSDTVDSDSNECNKCGFKGRVFHVCVEQEYIPEEITILKDHVYFAISALEIGVENAEELLSDHEQRFGRTTRKNRLTAERLEKEISDMKSALKNLK